MSYHLCSSGNKSRRNQLANAKNRIKNKDSHKNNHRSEEAIGKSSIKGDSCMRNRYKWKSHNAAQVYSKTSGRHLSKSHEGDRCFSSAKWWFEDLHMYHKSQKKSLSRSDVVAANCRISINLALYLCHHSTQPKSSTHQQCFRPWCVQCRAYQK